MTLKTAITLIVVTAGLLNPAQAKMSTMPESSQAPSALMTRIETLTNKEMSLQECPKPQTGVTCYHFFVPRSYQTTLDAASEKVKLFFSVRPANKSSKGILVINFGGPGLDGTEPLAYALAHDYFPAQILNHFDLIALDPRGTGQSAFSNPFGLCENLSTGDQLLQTNQNLCSTQPLSLNQPIL